MNAQKLISLVTVMLLHFTSINFCKAQAPTYVWAKTNIGNVETIQRATVVDALGNVFITGVFFGTVDFDPGAGVANITPSPYGCNIYIAKYDANGNYLWAKNIPITASYGGNQIAIDASSNLYITGYFQGTNIDFDPNGGTAFLSSAVGSNDIYFAKYDSNGNYLWAKQMGSNGDDRGNEILCDATGNVFLTGNFSLTVDFDPGAGVSNLTAFGTTDIFLAKFSSAGVYQWVKQIGGALGDDVRDIDFDNAGNIYLTGNFAGTADFDPSVSVANLTSAGGNDIFIAKYNASGNYLWANRFGSTGTDGGSALKADVAGNINVIGIFASTVDFDPGAGVTSLTTASSATFFGKYDINGNLVWMKQLPINFYSQDIAREPSGNIFISGYYGNGYGSPIDMNPGAGVANLNVASNLPPPTYNILGRYDALGNYLWAGVFGRQCYCSVMAYKSSLCIDATGYLYYSGIFNGPFGTGTVDFDPGIGVANLTAPSSVDNVFFGKYFTSAGPLPVELISFEGFNKNNKNILEWTTASEINNDYFLIEKHSKSATDEWTAIGKIKSKGDNTQIQNYSCTDENPLEGINYYRLKQVDLNSGFKYSQIIFVIKNQNSNINIFPNPATDEINITGLNLNAGDKIVISNFAGKLFFQKSISETVANINIEIKNFEPGIYFAKIISGSKIETIKLIKN